MSQTKQKNGVMAKVLMLIGGSIGISVIVASAISVFFYQEGQAHHARIEANVEAEIECVREEQTFRYAELKEHVKENHELLLELHKDVTTIKEKLK